MSNDSFRQFDADWKVELETDCSGAKPCSFVAGRQQDAGAGRDRNSILTASHKLIAIIERSVSYPLTSDDVVPDRGDRDREAELVLLSGYRPLLRERVVPIAAAASKKGADVLNDPGLLVIGLFYQETVILYRLWAGGFRRGR